MIDFYEIPPSPPCRSVKLLAKYLGIELNVHVVDILHGEQHKPEYHEINPFHKVPAINDDGFRLSESKAIMLYLLNKYAPDSPLYPADIKQRAAVDQMLFTDAGALFFAGVGVLRPQVYSGVEPPEEAMKKANDNLETLDRVLATRHFAASDELSLADFSIGPTLSAYEIAGLDITAYKNISKYLSRLRVKLSPIYEEVNDGPVEALKNIIKDKKSQNQ